MDGKQVARSLAAVIIKIAVAVLIVVLVYKMSILVYTFGFRIFAEKPMTEGDGITVTVSYMEDDTVRDLGQKLYDQGLIRDTKLFYFQELFSNYHGMEQPGVYELNTSMTVEEMLGKVAEGMPETERIEDLMDIDSSYYDDLQDSEEEDPEFEDMQEGTTQITQDIELPEEE